MPLKRLFYPILLVFISSALPAYADDGVLFGMERRRDQFSHDFGYFIYPISGKVPGIGTAYGGGATVTNIAETDLDFTGFYIRGDFEATGAAALNYHLIDNRLILDAANYTAKVAPRSYHRGMDSSRSDYIHLDVDSQVTVLQSTLSYFERQLEFYFRLPFGSEKLDNVIDSHGNVFSNIDKSRNHFSGLSVGFSLDVTDDRQDPRDGVRFEMKDRISFTHRADSSFYDVLDANLTYYHPVGVSSTWAFNAFYSTALLKKKGVTDRAEIAARHGLNCAGITDPAMQAECEKTQNSYIDEVVAENTYGRATSLGGTQRLRSYPMGRFYAGQSVFYGTEYRWNLTEESTMMDWYILRGLRTNVQMAFFGGVGSVADHFGDLFKRMKSSYGVGFRVLFTGVTIRLDWATGSEGSEVQLFLDYPWSMFSLDNVA